MFRKMFSALLFSSVLFQVSCAPVYYEGPVSDHFDGQQFYNPGQNNSKTFKDSLIWMLRRDRPAWPEYRELSAYDQPPERVNGRELRLAYVGHVSVLLQSHGLNILFDPVWSDRASPVTWAGPKRAHPPGIRFDELPPIDVVLLTHMHGDHIGGLMEGGKPAFPNARYVTGRTEYDFWVNPERMGTPAEQGHQGVLAKVQPLAFKTGAFIKGGLESAFGFAHRLRS